jgi:hypothetical protein
VLRETDPQPSLWEALLPEELKRLPAELAQIDAYLDDERFIAPWGAVLGPPWPTVAADRHAAAAAVPETPLWVGL